MEVQMFENNTFATTCGLGMTSREEKERRNSVVMSHSFIVGSEGRGLTKDDEKVGCRRL